MSERNRRSFPMMVEAYRKNVGEAFRAEIDALIGGRKEDGLFPFEGMWRKKEEIPSLQESMCRKDRTVFFEIVVVLVGMGVLNVIAALILFSL